MILVRNIRLPLSAGEPQAFEKALREARIPRAKVQHLGVAKLSVDARRGQPKLVYTVAVTLKTKPKNPPSPGHRPTCPCTAGPTSGCNGARRSCPTAPVVCGLGPAGLFAALLLAPAGLPAHRAGARPGAGRAGCRRWQHFSATGELDPNATSSFGEGGAGTSRRQADHPHR